MRRAMSVIIPSVLLLTAVACRHPREGDEQPNATPAAPVTVEVLNNFALPVEVDAIGTGTRVRLGTVHPGMRASFVIPQAVNATTTVELVASSSSTTRVARSGPLLLAPGSIVDFTVTPQLFNSTASIRP